MDLAKIIAELRMELQCLDTAITSMEELARAQNVADADIRPVTPPDNEPDPNDAGPQNVPPMKRGRGRPRKNAAQSAGDPPQHTGSDSGQASDSTTATAA
jgi:hypothetical protein